MSVENESVQPPSEAATETGQTTLMAEGGGQGAPAGAPTPSADDNAAADPQGGGDGGEGDPAGGTESGAPESYEFKVPEGVEGLTIDQAMADQFTPVFKELGLSQEQADKLVAAYAQKVAADTQSAQDAMVAEWQGRVRGWEEAARKDAEYGGAEFDANLSIAKQALKRYSSPELDALLIETGLGSHPDLVRAFVRIGKATAEDRPTPSSDTGGQPAKDHASVLYGTNNS